MEVLIFHLRDQALALPVDAVQRIAPMAQLARPPGLPAVLAGVLALGGAAVPVLRLDRLLGSAQQTPGLYSMLLILKQYRFALIADRISQIAQVQPSALLPVGENSFNGCVRGVIDIDGTAVHLLSETRLLLRKERESLGEFQAIAAGRLEQWVAEMR